LGNISVVAADLPDAMPNRAFCLKYVQGAAHVPDADVAYQPGVDAHGRQVAPAGTEDYSHFTPDLDALEIPITLDMGRYIALPTDATARAQVGTITFKNGKPYYNDKPLHKSQHQRLLRMCQDLLKARQP
jgi:hypothetical protein